MKPTPVAWYNPPNYSLWRVKTVPRRIGAARQWKHGRREELPHVAPASILSEDFRTLDSRVILRTAWHVEQDVLIQSVTSHAHMGHGVFHGQKFPNTTEDDTARALRLNPEAVKRDRQQLIDDVIEYVEDAIAGNGRDTLVNREGDPLMGVGFFRNLTVDPLGVLQGLYLGGLRDEPESREQAEKRYGIKIGWGHCYLVNKTVMATMGYNGDTLARQAHERDLDEFKKAGLIVSESGKDVAYMYIRHRVGPGASDDAAIIMAGKLFGPSAAAGVFLADAIDTLEKYATKNEDQDAKIGHYIASAYPELGVGEEDAAKIAYLAVATAAEGELWPDSSLRGLLEIDRKVDICALESHLLYVMDKPVPEIDLDHGECTNLEFYDCIEDRLSRSKK